MDDLISGGRTVQEAKELKEWAIAIFEDALFTLHKWQSSEPKLEGNPILQVDKEGEPCAGGSSLLDGLRWSKERDELIVSFPEWKSDPTREAFSANLQVSMI